MNAEQDAYERACALFDAWIDLPDDTARERAVAAARIAEPEAAALAESMLVHDETPSPWSAPQHANEDDPAGVLGERIGPYRVERLLGSGGMGAVYLGRRDDPREHVAIKFLSLARTSAASLERFADEARLLAAIDHPGIVRYRDSGVDHFRRPYLVMDYVEGLPLDPTSPPLADDVGATVDIVRELAQAVHALHQRGVLHRDLKPSNVLLRKEGKRMRPVLIDFGIARALAEDGPQPSATGTLGLGPVGTPAFMSPEQSLGSRVPDVRTDVHGIGAVAYALLTGRAPRSLENEEAPDPVEWHVRLRTTDPKTPSHAVAPAVFEARTQARRRSIDRNLDAIILKALAREPGQRYGSAEALAADLTRWREGRPVRARAATRGERIAKLVRRNPLTSALVSLTILSLAATAVLTSISRAREVRASERYRTQLERTERMNRFYIERVLSRALPEFDGPAAPVAAVLERAASDLPELDPDPRTSLAVRAALVGVFGRLGTNEAVDRQLEAGRTIARSLPLDDEARLNFEAESANIWIRRHDYDEGIAALRAILEHTGRDPERYGILDAQAANSLAVALLSRNALEEVDGLLDRAEQGLPLEHRDRSSVQNSRALLALMEGRTDDAAAAWEALGSWLTERYGPEHAELQGVHINLAKAHLNLRDPEGAMAHAREAMERGVRTLPEGHPDRILARSLFGSSLSMNGRYEEAIDVFLEVVSAQMEAFGPHNEAVGIGLANLASVLVSAGRSDEAQEPALQGLEILQEAVGEGHPDAIAAMVTVAHVHLAAGDTEAARRTGERALELYEALEGDYRRDVEETRGFLERIP